jgi:hypothetical protein
VLHSVLAFTVAGGKIDALANPERLARLKLGRT